MLTKLQRTNMVPLVSASADIGAPSGTVYRLIADYRDGHPRILPASFFRNLRVEVGGYGLGTVITFDMLAFGRTQQLRAHIAEPDPGRVLVETYPDIGSVTAFTVEALGAFSSRVTIATALRVKPGILGSLERWLLRRFLQRVYAAELELIDEQARSDYAHALDSAIRHENRPPQLRSRTTALRTPR